MTTLPATSPTTEETGARWLHTVIDTTGATLQQLPPRRFTDLAAGRLGVLARPGMRRANWLATDILTALGCDEGVTGAGRPGDGSLDLAVTWLRTHRIEHLYIQFAWSVKHPVLDDACETARRAGCQLWLVGDAPYTDLHSRRLEPFQPATWSGEEFLDHWGDWVNLPTRSAAGSPAVCESPWPAQLPADDLTTFRSACRDLLAPAQFAVVDEYLLTSHHRAAADLVPVLAESRDRLEEAEAAVAAWLAAEWEDTASLQHFVVFLRASQVAAFNAGYYLQVDLDQLVATAAGMPRRALRTSQVWQRLHTYADPHRAATCALAAAGMSVGVIPRMTVGDYDPSTGTATVDGVAYDVEAPARIFCEAQQTYRRLEGATDGDPFIATKDGTPVGPRALASGIKAARRELGVAVAAARIDRAVPDPQRWMMRWGVSIQDLL